MTPTDIDLSLQRLREDLRYLQRKAQDAAPRGGMEHHWWRVFAEGIDDRLAEVAAQLTTLMVQRWVYGRMAVCTLRQELQATARDLMLLRKLDLSGSEPTRKVGRRDLALLRSIELSRSERAAVAARWLYQTAPDTLAAIDQLRAELAAWAAEEESS